MEGRGGGGGGGGWIGLLISVLWGIFLRTLVKLILFIIVTS